MLRIALLVLTVLLALIQLRNAVAIAGIARPGSWASLVPAAARDATAQGAFVPPALRIALAREAIAAGRFDEAERAVAALPAGRDRADLTGAIEERRGRPYAAMDAYLIAGDGAAAQRLVDSSAAVDLPTAIGLQRRILASVESQPLRVKDQAEAWWRLGQLEQSVAYKLPGSQRSAGERAVLDAYEHAHANAPLDEKYLLAAANGALNLGDLATARLHFEQLLALDGGSIDSTLGLADTLLRAGDAVAARPLIERAAALGAGARADALRRRLP